MREEILLQSRPVSLASILGNHGQSVFGSLIDLLSLGSQRIHFIHLRLRERNKLSLELRKMLVGGQHHMRPPSFDIKRNKTVYLREYQPPNVVRRVRNSYIKAPDVTIILQNPRRDNRSVCSSVADCVNFIKFIRPFDTHKATNPYHSGIDIFTLSHTYSYIEEYADRFTVICQTPINFVASAAHNVELYLRVLQFDLSAQPFERGDTDAQGRASTDQGARECQKISCAPRSHKNRHGGAAATDETERYDRKPPAPRIDLNHAKWRSALAILIEVAA